MLHHSLTKDTETVSWAAIHKYHIEVMKWRDIGYHAGIEAVTSDLNLNKYKYQALKGRNEYDFAAACPQGYMNSLALHVCLIGNFDLLPPPIEMLHCLINRILLDWMQRYSIPVEHIVGHRDFNPMKSCPGKLCNLDLIKRMLA